MIARLDTVGESVSTAEPTAQRCCFEQLQDIGFKLTYYHDFSAYRSTWTHNHTIYRRREP